MNVIHFTYSRKCIINIRSDLVLNKLPKSKKSKKTKKTKTIAKPKKIEEENATEEKKKKRKRKVKRKEPIVEEIFEDFDLEEEHIEVKKKPKDDYEIGIVEEYLVEIQKEKPKVKIIDPPYLTKYEKARIIGARALQISMSAPIFVEIPKYVKEPIGIATYELSLRILPITVRRYFPNEEYLDVPLKKFELRYDEEIL